MLSGENQRVDVNQLASRLCIPFMYRVYWWKQCDQRNAYEHLQSMSKAFERHFS